MGADHSSRQRCGILPKPPTQCCNRAAARSSSYAVATSMCTRREQENARATLVVARELLRCRLAEGSRDALLSCVAELLDAAWKGTTPFRVTPATCAPQDAHAHTSRAPSPLWEETEGPRGGSSAHEIVHS